MKYPHHLLITTPGEGEAIEDPETGTYTPPEPVVVYDGRADVQDVGSSVVYGQDNVSKNSEAVAFLEKESVISSIKSGMAVVVTWNPDGSADDTEDAVVESITRLDGTVGLRRL